MTEVVHDLSKIKIDLSKEIERAKPLRIHFRGEIKPKRCILENDGRLLLFNGKYAISFADKKHYTALQCYILSPEDMNNIKMAVLDELL
jgi:hypothetical protein